MRWSVRLYKQGFKNLGSMLLRGEWMIIPRMLANYVWAILRIPTHVPVPLEFQAEPSASCNLECTMCNLDKSDDVDRFLRPAGLEKILNELGPVKSINFTGMGEGFLNPHLPDLVKLARKRGISTFLITNATVLKSDKITAILNAGIQRISISMESGKPATFESIRQGAKFDKFQANVTELVQQAKERLDPPQLCINITLLKINLDDLSHITEIIDFAKEVGIPEITVQNVSDIKMYGTYDDWTIKRPELDSKLAKIKTYAESKSLLISLPQTIERKGSCVYPWVYPQITASGELLPCCIIPQFGSYREIVRDYSFGNVFEEGFKAVWNGKKAVDFRRRLNSDPVPYCKKCSKYYGTL